MIVPKNYLEVILIVEYSGKKKGRQLINILIMFTQALVEIYNKDLIIYSRYGFNF